MAGAVGCVLRMTWIVELAVCPLKCVAVAVMVLSPSTKGTFALKVEPLMVAVIPFTATEAMNWPIVPVTSIEAASVCVPSDGELIAMVGGATTMVKVQFKP